MRSDYNQIADDFSRTRYQIWPEIKPLFDYINADDKVLDLGCGNGRYLDLIRERGGEYWGIDNSETLVKIAQHLHPQGRFAIADAFSLPFENQFFNQIYSIAVLHHIPSQELRLRFLEEAQRALQEKGFFILTVWQPKDKKGLALKRRFFWKKLLGLSKLDFGDILEPWADKAQRYYHCFTENELVDLVQKASFKIIRHGIIKNDRGNRQNIFLVVQKLT